MQPATKDSKVISKKKSTPDMIFGTISPVAGTTAILLF